MTQTAGDVREQLIAETITQGIAVQQKMLQGCVGQILAVAGLISSCLRGGGKVLLCGNGGSAADAQHVAAELVGRFLKERRALPAIALTTDSSILTSVGNDYGFDQVFARQVRGLVHAGDVVVGISTSGKSSNVIAALQAAKELNAKTVGFTGGSGGTMVGLCDLCFRVPSDVTARIQECQIVAWHAICDVVERELFG